MAFSSKYLQFAKATGTGVQTVTGVGFLGKALLLWTTSQTSLGATTGALLGLGMTDGVLQSVRFINHPGAESLTTSAQGERTDAIAWKTDATSGATPTILVRGVFDSFNSDGFDIEWTTNDGEAAIYHAIVLGGDISARFKQVKVDINAGETMDVEDVGFRPSSYIVMGGAADEFGGGDYNVGAPFGSVHGFGFSNTVDNVSGWTLGRGTGGASDCYRGQHTNRVSSIRVANLSGAGVLMDCTITASLSDGFTLARHTDSAADPVQHILCLKGVRAALGSFTAPLTATTKAVTLPFEPDLLMLQTLGATASESMAGMGLSFGAWQRADGDSGGVWIGGVDAADPSVYRRSAYENLVIETRDASSGSAVMRATVDSTSATGAVFGFSAVSGSADAILYMALAATKPLVGCKVIGKDGTIIGATRAFLASLDNEVNTLDEDGTAKFAARVKVKGQYASLAAYNAASGAAATIDFEDSNEHIVTLTANCTFTFSNPIDGGRYALLLVQDGTGSWTVTWPSNVRWANGTTPTLTTTAGRIDLTTFMYVASIDRYIAAWNLNYDPA